MQIIRMSQITRGSGRIQIIYYLYSAIVLRIILQKQVPSATDYGSINVTSYDKTNIFQKTCLVMYG